MKQTYSKTILKQIIKFNKHFSFINQTQTQRNNLKLKKIVIFKKDIVTNDLYKQTNKNIKN